MSGLVSTNYPLECNNSFNFICELSCCCCCYCFFFSFIGDGQCALINFMSDWFSLSKKGKNAISQVSRSWSSNDKCDVVEKYLINAHLHKLWNNHEKLNCFWTLGNQYVSARLVLVFFIYTVLTSTVVMCRFHHYVDILFYSEQVFQKKKNCMKMPLTNFPLNPKCFSNLPSSLCAESQWQSSQTKNKDEQNGK